MYYFLNSLDVVDHILLSRTLSDTDFPSTLLHGLTEIQRVKRGRRCEAAGREKGGD